MSEAEFLKVVLVLDDGRLMLSDGSYIKLMVKRFPSGNLYLMATPVEDDSK